MNRSLVNGFAVVVLIVNACATGEGLDTSVNMGSVFGGGGTAPDGDVAGGMSASAGRSQNGGFGPIAGGAAGAGTSGTSGNGPAGGSTCMPDEKLCNGSCTAIAPAVGCESVDCMPCLAPSNARAVCESGQCSFECDPGFWVSMDELGCDLADAGGNDFPDAEIPDATPEAGMESSGGAPGSGGTSSGGASSGGASAGGRSSGGASSGGATGSGGRSSGGASSGGATGSAGADSCTADADCPRCSGLDTACCLLLSRTCGCRNGLLGICRPP